MNGIEIRPTSSAFAFGTIRERGQQMQLREIMAVAFLITVAVVVYVLFRGSINISKDDRDGP